MAYAVSPSGKLDVKHFNKSLEHLLPKFEAISLREAEKKLELEIIYGKEIDICLDPTLLLTESDYLRFEEETGESDCYILVYAFNDGDNEVIKSTLDIVVSWYNIKVVDISLDTIEWKNDVVRRQAVTPGQFLSYFRNAVCVVTNSFHGTAFSLIYNRQFFTVPKNGTESRTNELMESLEMGDRVIKNSMHISIEPIDYNMVNSNIIKLRNKSLEYILEKICM